MKRMVLCMLAALLMIPTFALAEADSSVYPLNDNVYISAEFAEETYDVAVYGGSVCAWSLEALSDLFQFDTSKACETDDWGHQILLTNGEETLSISAAEDSRPLESFDFYYTRHADANLYSWMFQRAARYYCELESSALSFMSAEDAMAQCASILEQLAPGLTPVCAEVWGYSADDLNTVKEWLYANDDMYQLFIDNGKLSAPESFGADDEVYSLLFTFEIDGIPVYNCNESGLTLHSENEKEMANKMYCSITLTQKGIIDFSLKNCASLGSQASIGQTLPILDAAKIAAERYEDVIMSSPVVFKEVYLEYMPLIRENGAISFEPTWCFVAAPERNLKGILEACRIQAITGEVIN